MAMANVISAKITEPLGLGSIHYPGSDTPYAVTKARHDGNNVGITHMNNNSRIVFVLSKTSERRRQTRGREDDTGEQLLP